MWTALRYSYVSTNDTASQQRLLLMLWPVHPHYLRGLIDRLWYPFTKWIAGLLPSCLCDMWSQTPTRTQKPFKHVVVSAANVCMGGFWHYIQTKMHLQMYVGTGEPRCVCVCLCTYSTTQNNNIKTRAVSICKGKRLVFTKQTCSCDPSGSPAERQRLWPGPGVRRSGSTWAAYPRGWPHRPAHRTCSPSKSLAPVFPEDGVRTSMSPVGSRSPGSRWLQTSWRRKWAEWFAAEMEERRLDQGGLGFLGQSGCRNEECCVKRTSENHNNCCHMILCEFCYGYSILLNNIC